MEKKIVGIDLALPGRRKTGIAVINTITCSIDVWLVDSAQLPDFVLNLENIELIAIDAPLGLPKYGINRLIELNAKKLGLKLLPPLLGGMKKLTEFGIKLKNVFKEAGIKVIEVHPSSTLRILNLDRTTFLNKIKKFFKLNVFRTLTYDEIDAIISAYTGFEYLRNCYFSIKGFDNEGELILPKKDCSLIING